MNGKPTTTALQTLTAAYTDSENEQEEENDNSDASPKSILSEVKVSTQFSNLEKKSPTTVEESTPPIVILTSSPIVKKKSHLRLVSYNDIDDALISDEEPDSPSGQNLLNISISEGEIEQLEKAEKLNKIYDKYSSYGFSLPPEPKGKCPQELTDKIANYYERMRKSPNADMNKFIQDKKEFRNPSIYEKLIQFCNIKEFGTNYSADVYDPLEWGKDSFYEELAKIQKIEMDKREKDRKENAKKEMVLTAARKAEEEAKKRKSKWDQPAPNVHVATIPTTLVKANVIIPSSLTTNVTGTKTTVISAFGSLPKKPKQ